MKKPHLISMLALGLATSSFAQANEFRVSTGTGWPFLVVPQIAIQQDNHRYFMNYKLGLDHGFSIGYELQHEQLLYGAFIGAVGARQVSRDCSIGQRCNDLNIRVFDNNTTFGIGFSFEYRFQASTRLGFKNGGWLWRGIFERFDTI